MTDILTAWCPDCKVEMELFNPDDSESYYKCPRCRMEIAVEDVEED